jgi:hypothetical protein
MQSPQCDSMSDQMRAFEQECLRTLTRRRLHCPQPFRDFFEPSCVILGTFGCELFRSLILNGKV